MINFKIFKVGILSTLVLPIFLNAGSTPSAVKELAVLACGHIKTLEYKKLLPYSNDNAKYIFNHYVSRFEKMNKSYFDSAVNSMKNINCEKDTMVQDLGLNNYKATIKGMRSVYVIQTIKDNPFISSFK